MGAFELKNLVISKIAAIDDEVFLAAINTILDSKSKSNENNAQEIIMLTDQQKKTILNSQKEYSSGNYIENDVLNEEMEKWLTEE